MRFRLLAILARSLRTGWAVARFKSARRGLGLRRRLFLSAQIEALETRTLPSVVIPVPSHRDLVYDNTRDLLYITTDQGQLQRWDPVQQQLLTAYAFGAVQTGADITKDGAYLYVAETLPSPSGLGIIHKLDLAKAAVTELGYTLTAPEHSAWDINVNDQGVGLVSNQMELMDAWGWLRTMDTKGLFATKTADFGSGLGGSVRDETNIYRSPDRTFFVLLEPGLATGPIMTYDSMGQTFLNHATLNVDLSTSLAAVNRSNSQVAVEVGSDVLVMDQALKPLYSLAGVDGGILYDTRRDILYGASSTTDEIIAFSSATGRELYRLPTGVDVTPSTPYGNGEMEISDNGKWLFIAETGGVVMLDLQDPPNLSVNDVSVVEGNSGTKDATFTVSLSSAATQPVTVDYVTANGTATSGSDYDATSGTLSFAPGETAKTVTVKIHGDRIPEANETFFLNLSNANHAWIRDNQGVGTIVNDDVGVTLTSTAPNPVLTPTFTVKVQFGEPIDPSTFDASDITVTNGSVVSITKVSNSEFNVVIQAKVDGPVTVSIGDSKVSTIEGYTNVASNVFTTVVDAVNDPPTISSIADQVAFEDSVVGPLSFTIGDTDSNVNDLTLTSRSSNATIVPAANIVLGGSGANRTVTVTPAANQWGTLSISLTVTDPRDGTATTSFTVTVNPVADTPTVTNSSTVFPQQTTGGLVISRNIVDGLEVTHFQITNITGGTLFQNDGVTPINSRDFITYAQAHAGLKFTPAVDSNGTGSFQIQASLSETAAGLGGNVITATIDVVGLPMRMYRAYNPVADFHFFTTRKAEFDNAVAHGYRDETTGRPGYSVLSAQGTGSVPLYRLYNLQRGFHYYTADPTERQILIGLVPITSESFGKIGWRDEGIEGYVFNAPQSPATSIYRLYNLDSGTHLFTESAAVKDAILQQFPNSWREETQLGYAFEAAAVGTIPGDGGSQLPATRKALRASETVPASVAALMSEATAATVRTPAETSSPNLGGLLAASQSGSSLSGNTLLADTANSSRDDSPSALWLAANVKPPRTASSPLTLVSDWAEQSTQFFRNFDARAWE